MSSLSLTFKSREEHRQWLAGQAKLPRGFRVGTSRINFVPAELPKPATMMLTLVALDKPSENFAAVFTRNALPGEPVKVGRRRLREPELGAILVNNKISNVCAAGGAEAVDALCAEAGRALKLRPESVFPGSTGIIGWELPLASMLLGIPEAAASLQSRSLLPAAEAIMTTDLYPKVRSAPIGAGRIVGTAKGAGMIEPNLATMLVYILTDISIPRDSLRDMLTRVTARTFNRLSIDSDTSTSDTVLLVSSGLVPCEDESAFESTLEQLCQDLAEDLVRNGEGVRHVIRIRVCGAPNESLAAGIGKAVVNAPLFKCAIAGNDPNVGRLVQAVGKHVGTHAPDLDLGDISMSLGGINIVERGHFSLDPVKEAALVKHLVEAEMYRSAPNAACEFLPPIDYPPHERFVEVEIDLKRGVASAATLGADLTHEYVTENADYRS